MRQKIAHHEVAVIVEALAAASFKIEMLTDTEYSFLLQYLGSEAFGNTAETHLVEQYVKGFRLLSEED